ncbi:MAG: hypothetical protein AAB506_01285 [Patescibacteria group bacterium]
MTATSHAIVGAAIASKIPDLRIALPLAFLSHFVLDKLPHWDVMTEADHNDHKAIFIKSSLDVFLGLISVFIFANLTNSTNWTNLFLGSFVAQFPDWLEAPYFLGFKIKIFSFNYRFQHWIHDIWFDSRLPAPWGIITQLVVVTLFILWSLI